VGVCQGIRLGAAPRDAEQRETERDADNRQREREPAQERWQPGDRQDQQAETGKKDEVLVHKGRSGSGAPVPIRKWGVLDWVTPRALDVVPCLTPRPDSGECVRPSRDRRATAGEELSASLPCAQPVTRAQLPLTALNVAPCRPPRRVLATGRGYSPSTPVTRVGKLELRVPRDRHGRFSTELFERYQRSEWRRALHC
jgi:hypothetical protein